MALSDYFNTNFEDFYSNPSVVLIAFFLIFFILIFTALSKTIFRDSRKSSAIVALIISLISVYYFRDLSGWIGSFNLILTLVVILILLIIVIPFFKFAKKQF